MPTRNLERLDAHKLDKGKAISTPRTTVQAQSLRFVKIFKSGLTNKIRNIDDSSAPSLDTITKLSLEEQELLFMSVCKLKLEIDRIDKAKTTKTPAKNTKAAAKGAPATQDRRKSAKRVAVQ